MDKNQQAAFAHDLKQVIAQTMAKHGVGMAKLAVGIDGSGNMVIKIGQPKVTAATAPAQPSPNAIDRYKKFGAKLALPKIGTMLMVGGKEYALVGLSSDGSRVKAVLSGPTPTLADLPLAAVQAATAAAGAKQVAELDKAEQAVADDVVDPEITALLVALGKKPATKPAEGQQ